MGPQESRFLEIPSPQTLRIADPSPPDLSLGSFPVLGPVSVLSVHGMVDGQTTLQFARVCERLRVFRAGRKLLRHVDLDLGFNRIGLG